ncbi:MAG TPA: DNA ligase [Candidatus Fimivivens faecavium]|nr:DNA ligase [Candidatus Fimivivens faecavium]
MDLFDTKSAKPMLIRDEVPPFDDPDYLFELKFDGTRCLAYLGEETALINKRDIRLLPVFPELEGLHRQVGERCILDGELIVVRDGRVSFEELQKRQMAANPFKVSLRSKQAPASFVAYDILYLRDREVTGLPLTGRKELLEKTVRESPQLAVSRCVEEFGKAFFEQTARKGLEGIVGKKKTSLYRCGERTRDWVKIKNMCEDDFIVCGAVKKEKGVALVLAKRRGEELVYRGHVTGLSREAVEFVLAQPEGECPFDPVPGGNERARWIAPSLVCTVRYLYRTPAGNLRQPAFRGFRNDKLPEECVE